MNTSATGIYEEEILVLLFMSELSQFHVGEIWDRIGSNNELSMAYTLFQSLLELYRDEGR